MSQTERLYQLLGDIDDRYIVDAADAPKKNRKTIVLKAAAIAACVALLVCGGYGVYQWSDIAGAMSFSSVYYPSGPSGMTYSAMMTLLGTTLEELYEEADIVVIARVTEDDLPEYGSDWTSSCLSMIRVLSAYKGHAAAGDELTIREIGFRKGADEEYSLDGVPLLHEDMCVLLFLRAGTEQSDGVAVHTICGEYQGKFFFDTNGMLHESAELGSDSVAVIEGMESMSYEVVTEKLCALRDAR